MSTGYGSEGLRQVCATLLGAPHVPERLCSLQWHYLLRGAITNFDLYLFTYFLCIIAVLLALKFLH